MYFCIFIYRHISIYIYIYTHIYACIYIYTIYYIHASGGCAPVGAHDLQRDAAGDGELTDGRALRSMCVCVCIYIYIYIYMYA